MLNAFSDLHIMLKIMNYADITGWSLPETIFLLKVDNCEGFLNWCKIYGMVNDNLSKMGGRGLILKKSNFLVW